MKSIATLVSIAALALVACGDDDDANNTSANNTSNNMSTNTPTCNPTFSEADACGGDLIGTWSVDGACLGDVEVPNCPTAEVIVNARDISGTLVVTDTDWTYDVSGALEFSANIPASCVMDAGGDCDALAMAVEAECTDPGDGSCDCTAEESVSIASSGTYTVEDGNRAVIDNGEEWLFCVEGDGISLRDSNADGSPTFVGSR